MPHGPSVGGEGVRFVQIFSGGWDSHDYLERAHAARIKSVDQPMTALIKDLKNRGMLKDTLVLWLGEFGRTPDNNRRGGVYAIGRGHNNQAMTILMAGGGVKPGSIVGATDSGREGSRGRPPDSRSASPSFICSGWMTTSSPSFTQDATSNSASSADKSSAN